MSRSRPSPTAPKDPGPGRNRPLAGTPGNPFTEKELEAKFRNNASYSMLKSSKVDKLIEMIYELEKVDDISKVTMLLTVE